MAEKQYVYGSLEDRKQKLAKARKVMRTMAQAIIALELEMGEDVGIRDGVSDLVSMTQVLRSAGLTMEREREAIMEMAITDQVGGVEG